MSTYEEALKCISLDADASLATYTGISGMPGAASPNYGKQYSFVRITGPHTCGLMTAVGQKFIGVLQNKPQKLGTACTVATDGVSNLIAGTGGFSAGDRIKPDGNGHGIVAADGDVAYGIAMDAAIAGAMGPVEIGRV